MCLKKSDGVLTIDLGNDEAPVQIKFKTPLDILMTKKRIILDVDPTPYEYYKNYILDNETSEKEES